MDLSGISDKRRILIVSDGKKGHLHQSEGIVKRISNSSFVRLDITPTMKQYYYFILIALIGRRVNLSSEFIISTIQKITKTSMHGLAKYVPDLIVSTGSLTHPVTFLLGRLWQCPTVVCMTPSVLSTSDFDLVVAPRHDEHRCKGSNIIFTLGATSQITPSFIFAEAASLYPRLKTHDTPLAGLLIGGNSATSFITSDMAASIVRESLHCAAEHHLSLLVTTSRRTPPDVEAIVRKELFANPHCSYLLLASESDFNPVPGIIGLSDFVIVTEDSVSMASEIVTGGKFAVVIQVGKKKKKNKFESLFKSLVAEGHIAYTSIKNLHPTLSGLLLVKRESSEPLDEAAKVAREIELRFFHDTTDTTDHGVRQD